jgi:hypothetical protein
MFMYTQSLVQNSGTLLLRYNVSLRTLQINNDFVAIIGGSNDTDLYQPYSLSIIKGLADLLSLDIETNVLISDVFYRFDAPKLNDDISYANRLIEKRVTEYEGKLNVTFCDMNTVLQRHHFTRHGLHLNRRGKRLLSNQLIDIIKRIEKPRAVCTQTGSGGSKRVCPVDADISAILPCPSQSQPALVSPAPAPAAVVSSPLSLTPDDADLSAILPCPTQTLSPPPVSSAALHRPGPAVTAPCSSPATPAFSLHDFPPLPTKSLQSTSNSPTNCMDNLLNTQSVNNSKQSFLEISHV